MSVDLKKMERQKKARQCYLIDKKFCEVVQKKIAVAMGEVASLQNSGEESTEILNELADIRGFFQRRELRAYSDKLMDSIDMKSFINPGKPVCEV